MSECHMTVYVDINRNDDTPILLLHHGDDVFRAMVTYRGLDLADWRWRRRYDDDAMFPHVPREGGLWVLDGDYTEPSEDDYTAAITGEWRRPTIGEVARLTVGGPVWDE